MSDAIITVENPSKKYLVGHKSGIRSRSNYIALRDVVGSEIGNVPIAPAPANPSTIAD